MSTTIYIISCKDCKRCKIIEFDFESQHLTDLNLENKLSFLELNEIIDEIQEKYKIKIKYSDKSKLFDLKDNVLKQTILKLLIKEINMKKRKDNIIKDLDELIYKFRPVSK